MRKLRPQLQQHDPAYTKSQSSIGAIQHAQVIGTSIENPDLPNGAILFKLTNNSAPYSGYALPIFQSLQNIPLIDEHVTIIHGPSSNISNNQPYYLPPLNLWNHPQHGGKGTDGNSPRLNSDFRETIDVNPMKPFSGDFLIEGRRGQSLRFSESSSNRPWKSDTTASPIIALVNGQIQTQEGVSLVVEDINLDPASIYLTSQNQLPLEVNLKWARIDNLKRYSSYLPGNEPLEASTYLGSQVILNSGRIYINSNKEHVLLSAADTVGILGQKVNLDAAKTITFEAPLINLTGDALNPTIARSAVKGEDLVDELTGLYSRLAKLTLTLQLVLSSLNVPTDSAAELTKYLFKSENLEDLSVTGIKGKLKEMLSNRVKIS